MYDMQPYLATIDRVIADGPYQDDWDSLAGWRVPAWYQQAKFGIFIHWGVYSVPAFGSEWYSRNMYIQGSPEYEHHLKTYGPHKDFGYKDFIPRFTAEHFDPDAWAALFKEAGARYVVPVAEHHDGFQMYRSEISHWNAYEMGPHRDVLGELEQSFTRQGLITGASSHRVEHWFFMGHGKDFDSDIKEPLQRGDFYWPAMPEADHFDLFSKPEPSQEYMQDWLLRTCEIIDRYQPRLLYFDWWIQHSAMKPYLKKLAAYYYNRAAERGQEVAINYKHDAFMFGTAVPDIERGQFATVQPYFWQTDTAIALNSWCYTENNQFRPYEEILCDLVDIVSKNGTLLLNVGPKADGTISGPDQAVLRGIGAWLKVNGQAIYDSSVWRESGEGPTVVESGQFTDGKKKPFTPQDFRFTRQGSYLYAIALKPAADGHYCIHALGRQDASRLANFSGLIREVTLLGADRPINWERQETGLLLNTGGQEQARGAQKDCPLVFKIRVD
ncbi:alpha-L-fucosidase [Oscillospiraceae bacterium HV4-5-C5C]|nr:alpha-L-fucosidase [Oscillospiraceae bacterium HV4-5-C5C]